MNNDRTHPSIHSERDREREREKEREGDRERVRQRESGPIFLPQQLNSIIIPH